MTDRVIRYQMIGEDVRRVQAALNLRGTGCPLLKMDGIYGNLSFAKVVQFQKSCHLVPDGIVGEKTRAALFPDMAAIRYVDQSALVDYVLTCLKREDAADLSLPPSKARAQIEANLRSTAYQLYRDMIDLVFSPRS